MFTYSLGKEKYDFSRNKKSVDFYYKAANSFADCPAQPCYTVYNE